MATTCDTPELKMSRCGIRSPDLPRVSMPTSATRALMPRSITSAKKV